MNPRRLRRTRRALLNLLDWFLCFPFNFLGLFLTWLMPFAIGALVMAFVMISLQLHWLEGERARKLLLLQEERDSINNMKLIDEDHGMLIFNGANPDAGIRPHFLYEGMENVLYMHEYFAQSFKTPVEIIMVRVIPNKHKKSPESPDNCLETEYMSPTIFEPYAEQAEKWKRFGWLPLVEAAKLSDEQQEEWLRIPWHCK